MIDTQQPRIIFFEKVIEKGKKRNSMLIFSLVSPLGPYSFILWPLSGSQLFLHLDEEIQHFMTLFAQEIALAVELKNGE